MERTKRGIGVATHPIKSQSVDSFLIYIVATHFETFTRHNLPVRLTKESNLVEVNFYSIDVPLNENRLEIGSIVLEI